MVLCFMRRKNTLLFFKFVDSCTVSSGQECLFQSAYHQWFIKFLHDVKWAIQFLIMLKYRYKIYLENLERQYYFSLVYFENKKGITVYVRVIIRSLKIKMKGIHLSNLYYMIIVTHRTSISVKTKVFFLCGQHLNSTKNRHDGSSKILSLS